ncbi:hypothetical protein Ddc_14519 [Ditylenchus destructor]|nr:hypothetical protein Ddc_14519 [Ditylenchus destructor]
MNGMSIMDHFPQHAQGSELQPLVLRNDVWSPLGYDTKIDVFKFLRAYDIKKHCIYVNKSWSSFCFKNQNYLPRQRPVPLRTVEQSACSDEIKAFDQRIVDNYIENVKWTKRYERREKCKICSLFLTFSTLLLSGGLSAAFLVIRIRGDASPVDDLLLQLIFMVLSIMITWPLEPDRYNRRIISKCKSVPLDHVAVPQSYVRPYMLHRLLFFPTPDFINLDILDYLNDHSHS